MTATDAERIDWDGSPVDITRWGKDHWSTFAYVETRIMDHDGYLDPVHLRGCNQTFSTLPAGREYPTRLRGQFGETVNLVGHDDRDCITDAVAAGLLEGGRATQRNADDSIKALTWQYVLTPKGHVVVGALRAHKAEGGNFRDFGPVAIQALHEAGKL